MKLSGGCLCVFACTSRVLSNQINAITLILHLNFGANNHSLSVFFTRAHTCISVCSVCSYVCDVSICCLSVRDWVKVMLYRNFVCCCAITQKKAQALLLLLARILNECVWFIRTLLCASMCVSVSMIAYCDWCGCVFVLMCAITEK